MLDRTPKAVRGGLRDLLTLELIAHPAAAEPGYALTAHGLALLAAQAGMRPAELHLDGRFAPSREFVDCFWG